jgi:hypothetical protein
MKLGCEHCKGGPEPGFIETDNNGPILACLACNPTGDKDRAWDRAEAQRDYQRQQGVEIISQRSQQIGGVTVNFTVGRIGARRR